MARRDRKGEQILQQIKKREYSTALERYHTLASKYHQLNSTEDKRELVASDPLLATQIYYHFRDTELRNLIVSSYRKHPNDDLRQLAHGVRALRTSETLSEVLGMHSVPLEMHEEDDEKQLYFDYALAVEQQR